MSAASTVDEIPRLIMREAKAWRIEWWETRSIPTARAASSKPRLVAFLCPSGQPKLRVLSVEQQCATRILGELRASGLEEVAELESALADDPVIGPRRPALPFSERRPQVRRCTG